MGSRPDTFEVCAVSSLSPALPSDEPAMVVSYDPLVTTPKPAMYLPAAVVRGAFIFHARCLRFCVVLLIRGVAVILVAGCT